MSWFYHVYSVLSRFGSTAISYRRLGTYKISWDQFWNVITTVADCTTQNVSVLSAGAARGGPGFPQILLQSPFQVPFEESENHAVQSHPSGRLRLHLGCRGERSQLMLYEYKRELEQQELEKVTHWHFSLSSECWSGRNRTSYFSVMWWEKHFYFRMPVWKLKPLLRQHHKAFWMYLKQQSHKKIFDLVPCCLKYIDALQKSGSLNAF